MSIRKSTDLLLIIIVTAVAAVAIMSGIKNIVRVLLAIPLVFVFPGYAVVAAMFSHKVFRFETYLVFGVALSIALTALIGLALNFTSYGLQPQIWMLLLVGITLIGCAIAILRRQISPWFTSIEPPIRFSWGEIAMVGLAVILGFFAVGVARNGVTTEPQPGFTQLWMLPPSSSTSSTVNLGIRNEENNSVSYHLIISAGNNTLAEWDDIQLDPGEQWENQIAMSSVTAAAQVGNEIDARLYRDNDPNTIYRSTSFALNSQQPNS